ncbi:MAG: GAF domain-containing protein [Sediminibacterium sp.]|nr:GAF domain-containing protein [Sediminibacterium sp.]
MPNGKEELLSISKTCCDQIAHTKKAVEANPNILVDIITEPFNDDYLAKRKNCFTNLSSVELEIKCELTGGLVKWFQLFATTKLLADKSIVFNVIQTDITESKLNEEKLLKFNRELSLRNIISDTIDQQENLQDLFNAICTSLVNDGGYVLAAITPMPESDNPDRRLHPIAASGCTDYINEIVIDLSNPIQRKGPAASSLLLNKTIITNDFHSSSRTNPWHVLAERYNIAASIVIPLSFANDAKAIISIYSDRIDAYDEHEVEILEKIAHSLSIAAKAIQHKMEKNKAEVELLQTKANLTAIFKNTDIGYILLDKFYCILSFNEAIQNGYASLLGISLRLGGNFIELLPAEIKKNKKDSFFKVISEKRSIDYEVAHDFNNELVYYFISIHPIIETNKFMGFAFSAQDITYRKKAELEQQRITHDLIRRNRDLEQFSYIVSHNIRAPLSNILGLKGAMKIASNKEETDFLLDGIGQSAEILDQVVKDVNQILQINRTIVDTKETILLEAVFDEVIIGLADFIHQRNAIIKADFLLAPDVFSVKSYIVSIFHTLIFNGLKYAKPTTIPTIKIWSHYSETKLVIHFIDNGLGIDLNKYGAAFFGLYKRFHPQVQGKGLGLFLVKSQIQFLGGEISVNSTPDVGTEFIISLPLS